jgi:hypothetical protein
MRRILVVLGLFNLLATSTTGLLSPAMAQERLTGADCHPESVVLTHCDAPAPSGGVPASAASKAAEEDARKKAELAAALERQRQRNARDANATSPDQLERAEVVGQRVHTPTASEVFNSYFGSPAMLAPDITQSTDQMGNRTECVTHCVGPFCCKTVPANPGTPNGP